MQLSVLFSALRHPRQELSRNVPMLQYIAQIKESKKREELEEDVVEYFIPHCGTECLAEGRKRELQSGVDNYDDPDDKRELQSGVDDYDDLDNKRELQSGVDDYDDPDDKRELQSGVEDYV
ncbi:uncharacterized protein BJ212DRAFT_1298728 [Suillus subaureus]|uniref:Uncharacterized protein n=1 Tax=Suillus subaureus TaxID=48587 RepID=A0A9P7JEL9_9AGAM|nr:uncharacterized protein BJ212DRAFT_1298728 [Suillus subaureus]KAG1818669.1 hypothetical protein BJ212DRAFT_1298728 [Suillus subaureus]